MAIPLTHFPLPLTYQALEAATFNTFLSPLEREPIENSSFIGRMIWKVGDFIGGTVRVVIRLIYGISCTVFLAPFGLIYHTVASLAWKRKSWRAIDPKEKIVCSAIAWEHLKSAMVDASGMHLAYTPYFMASPRNIFLDFTSPNKMVNISSKTTAAVGKGWLDYNLQVHNQCPYSSLIKGKIECQQLFSRALPLGDPRIVKYANETSYSSTFEYKKTPNEYEQIHITPLLGRVSFSFPPTKALASTAIGFALFSFGIMFGVFSILVFIAPLTPLSVIVASYFLFSALALPTLGAPHFLHSRVLYVKHRGQKDYEFAEKLASNPPLTKENSLQAGAWFFKSCQGHPEAQRRYGTLLLAKALKKIDFLDESSFEEERKYWLKKALEGFEWIAAAAENGNITARNLLDELFTSDVPDSLLRTPSTPLEKLQQLLLSHQFKQALVEFQDKFTKELSPGPNDVYIHLDTLVENHLQSQKDAIVKVVDETALFPAVIAKVIAEYAAFV